MRLKHSGSIPEWLEMAGVWICRASMNFERFVYGCLMLQLLVTVGRLRWTCQRRWGRDFTVKPCESLSSRRQGSQRQEDTSGPSRRRTFQYISILFNTCQYISILQIHFIFLKFLCRKGAASEKPHCIPCDLPATTFPCRNLHRTWRSQ